MNHLNIHLSDKAKKTLGNRINIKFSETVYDWIEENGIDYRLFNKVIRNCRGSTNECIIAYNCDSNNLSDMTEEIFNYIIYLVNTNQNTYHGIGPFINIDNMWMIMTRDNYNQNKPMSKKTTTMHTRATHTRATQTMATHTMATKTGQ